jgi:hypothetical protein
VVDADRDVARRQRQQRANRVLGFGGNLHTAILPYPASDVTP